VDNEAFMGTIEASSQCWRAFPGQSPRRGVPHAQGTSRESAHPIPTFLPIRWPSRLQSCFSPPSRRCIVVISAASTCGPIELLRLYFNIIWPLALNARSVVCLTVVWAPPLTPPSLSTARERIATMRVPCAMSTRQGWAAECHEW
jgi:hypothetical protein